jgi:flagellar hook-length control protein FliK
MMTTLRPTISNPGTNDYDNGKGRSKRPDQKRNGFAGELASACFVPPLTPPQREAAAAKKSAAAGTVEGPQSETSVGSVSISGSELGPPATLAATKTKADETSAELNASSQPDSKLQTIEAAPPQTATIDDTDSEAAQAAADAAEGTDFAQLTNAMRLSSLAGVQDADRLNALAKETKVIEEPTKPALSVTASELAKAGQTMQAKATVAPVGEATPDALKQASGDPFGQAQISVDPPIAGDQVALAQTLQAQAAQRDATLMAGYLAQANRPSPDANSFLTITRQFGAGSDLDSNQQEAPSSALGDSSAQAVQAEMPFAAIAKDIALAGAPETAAMQSAAQIIAQAETLNLGQIRSLRLRLQPEELGQVEIQLKRDAQGKISVHLSAERETARQALSQTLGQLRETLERAGLTVDRLQVKSSTTSLNGHEANENPTNRDAKAQSTGFKSRSVTETEERGAERVHDHKLLSLSA